ncbi:SPASM domain-containing protein [Photobacterium galatheae]|uniref:4Fe4S-binding SPASM domain-containing protein n=1 Tax=Photobacterium galatheae TaxID=1654360 RepID=A0A066RI02_9GAMM|nr:SPASM domain-containing protein [Photobacterium galatheae]KDM89954.1 hypothetical protein EA58_19615 [Photobacterium galatheae]MCM0149251.1 SPASM domain-containing protein [Photobacterium galatheae]
MSLLQLSESLDSLKNYMETLGLNPPETDLTVCFLGGELSTLNYDYLCKAKYLVEASMKAFSSIVLGMQTNLIMSTGKLDLIYELFDGNIGTSIDNFSDARRFKGSANLYRETFHKNLNHISETKGKSLGACYVVSGESITYAEKEISLAKKNGYPIKLIVARQNYKGESSFQFDTDIDALTDMYIKTLNDWFMQSQVAIDPLLYMLNRKLSQLGDRTQGCFESCNFTNKCHTQGVSIEPNGDFYFCQELADLKVLKLGNLISGDLDNLPITTAKLREENIAVTCSACEHFVSCKGGCMAYSVDLGRGFSNKDPYCSLYYRIFSRIDDLIREHGLNEVLKWRNAL